MRIGDRMGAERKNREPGREREVQYYYIWYRKKDGQHKAFPLRKMLTLRGDVLVYTKNHLRKCRNTKFSLG